MILISNTWPGELRFLGWKVAGIWFQPGIRSGADFDTSSHLVTKWPQNNAGQVPRLARNLFT